MECSDDVDLVHWNAGHWDVIELYGAEKYDAMEEGERKKHLVGSTLYCFRLYLDYRVDNVQYRRIKYVY